MRTMAEQITYLILAFGGFLLPTSLGAQTVDHVGIFWAFTGVEFLPGGYVVKDDEGDIEQYIFKDSKFLRFRGEIPAPVKVWNAYSAQPDFLDQIDVRVFLPGSSENLLPKRAKVKKFFEMDVPGTMNTLLLMCYTRQLRIEGSNTNDIYLTAALNSNPSDLRSEYRKLWTRKLRTETNYGDLQYQFVPGAGDFLLLYTEDVAGDAVTHELDVYRIRGLEEPKAQRKNGAARHQRDPRPEKSPQPGTAPK